MLPGMEADLAAEALVRGESLTGAELLHWRAGQLRLGGRAADLDWLIDLAGGVRWADLQRLRLQPGQLLKLRCSCQQLAELWRRHLTTFEPLQYLVGCCPWRDLELRVAAGVLIPRPETELLLEWALATAPRPDGGGCWADLGTGSGCLALALSRALPGWRGLAVDCSAEALQQAAQNLAAHGLAERVALLQGSWWQPLQPWWGQLDLVLANPPYIPSAVVDGLEPGVRLHEPRLALDGGCDGLEPIRCIVDVAPRALAPGGWLLLEHHHDQSEAVAELLGRAGLVEHQVRCDLEGQRRFAMARRRRP